MGSVVDTVLYGMFLLVSLGGPGAEWSARWPRGPSLFAGAQLVPYRTSNDRYLDPCKASKYRKTLKSPLPPPPAPQPPLPTPLFLSPCCVAPPCLPLSWPTDYRCQITPHVHSFSFAYLILSTPINFVFLSSILRLPCFNACPFLLSFL